MTMIIQDRPSVVEYKEADIQLMKETICKGGTESDFRMFLMICQRTRLDPFAKQIYAVVRWDTKLQRNSMTVQTSIDGLRLVAERTGRYAPGRATTYDYDQDGKLRSATAFIKKQTADGTWHEISYTAFYDEYVQKTKEGYPTKFWKDMGHVMLAKVAEAAALRRCFPMELSGLYTKDEMAQAEPAETNEMPETIEIQKPIDDEIIVFKTQELLGNFQEEERPLVRKYIDKWCSAHSKSVADALQRFEKIEELRNQFNVWKEKQKA